MVIHRHTGGRALLTMTNANVNQGLSRREFLRLGSASLLSLFAISPATYAYAKSVSLQASTSRLGRIVSNNIDMYDSPSLDGKLVRTLWKDLVMEITSEVTGGEEPAHNRVWYQLDGLGYVHSGHVQPVHIDLNELNQDIPATGALAEVTVPFTDAVWNPILRKIVATRLYYSTTHWITGILTDTQGETWYELLEDFYQYKYYVKPSHLRVVQPEEVAPLSPEIPVEDKRLEVHLNDQIVLAFEGDNQVKSMRCSGGRPLFNIYLTPTGSFTTDYKRPSRHMISGSPASGYGYDLPGVPWVSYFTEKGISFHGTFWHNDFGLPRSHGCINLPSEDAKWVYRWTLPVVPFEEQKINKPKGTRVEITL